MLGAGDEPLVDVGVARQHGEQLVLGEAVAGGGQVGEGVRDEHGAVVLLVGEAPEGVGGDDPLDAGGERLGCLVAAPAAGLLEREPQVERIARRGLERVEHGLFLGGLEGAVRVVEPPAQQLGALARIQRPELDDRRAPLLERAQGVLGAGGHDHPHARGDGRREPGQTASALTRRQLVEGVEEHDHRPAAGHALETTAHVADELLVSPRAHRSPRHRRGGRAPGRAPGATHRTSDDAARGADEPVHDLARRRGRAARGAAPRRAVPTCRCPRRPRSPGDAGSSPRRCSAIAASSCSRPTKMRQRSSANARWERPSSSSTGPSSRIRSGSAERRNGALGCVASSSIAPRSASKKSSPKRSRCAVSGRHAAASHPAS